MCIIWSSHILLVRRQNGTHSRSGKQFVSCLLNRLLAHDSVIPLRCIDPREQNLMFTQKPAHGYSEWLYSSYHPNRKHPKGLQQVNG